MKQQRRKSSCNRQEALRFKPEASSIMQISFRIWKVNIRRIKRGSEGGGGVSSGDRSVDSHLIVCLLAAILS